MSTKETQEDFELVKEVTENSKAVETIKLTKKKLQREKNLIDSQLQAGIESQVKVLTEGTSCLNKVRNDVGSLKTKMGHMDESYHESLKHVPDFDNIQQISTMLTNFDLTMKFVDHLNSFPQQLQQVENLLSEDGEFDVDKEMPNLLPTHYLLSQLRQVREEATKYLHFKDVTSDTRMTVRKLYEPLDRLTAAFDGIIMAIAEDVLETVRVGNRSLIVRVAKIIEAEERQDFVAQFSESHSMKSGELSNRDTLTAQQIREPRKYLDKFLGCIESSIKQQFDNCMGSFPPDTQPQQLLENLNFINSELVCARDELASCCPARWQIFNKFVNWYHNGVYHTLDTIMRFEPPAIVLLDLLQYVKDYYSTMNSVFQVNKKTSDLLQPPLLNGREQDLYTDYLNMLVAKLREWYNNIWQTEKTEFLEGTLNPEYYSGGVGLESYTTISKLVTQQLEVAAESSQAKVIAGCVDACCEIYMERQKEWIKLMRFATKKEINGEPDSPKGLYEYIFVIANDQDRSYALLDELSAHWSGPMPPKYQSRVVDKFAEAQEGFQDVTKECFLCNLQIIFTDTKPAFEQIFASDKWYSGASIKAIIDTFADFVQDAKKLLLPDLFEIFLGKLCTDTILEYLRSMIIAPGGKPKKLNMPRAKSRIVDDAKELFDFFTNAQFGLDPEMARRVFYIFDLFCDVEDAPLSEIPALFKELRSNERDAPVDLFECMLMLRQDVDQKVLRTVMAEVRDLAVHSEPLPETEQSHSFLYEFKRTKL